ncbi:MAG: D-alanyl-D-alanine carboxypeptidase family protein [Kiritimatiellae bacterium]|nr:D-alanyl-D-alanine carboxypeptidase family protein [Kiritimatiellia bacterium]
MNLSRLRVAWNVALVRLGVRKVLPREAVNRVPVEECGEPLVPWGGGWVRKEVARRLEEASRRLPEGYSLELMEGWRSPEEQERLREETRAAKRAEGLDGDELARAVARWVANDSGHRTGGAVDVRLAFRGREAFCGSAWKEFGTGTASDARVGAEAARNRAILHRAMRAAGFANYPAEWWHFAFGDRLWAAYRGKRRAVYGPVETPGGEGGRTGTPRQDSDGGAMEAARSGGSRR